MGYNAQKKLWRPTTKEVLILRKRRKVFGKSRKVKMKEREEIENGIKEWEEKND